ncbi:MAG TPA: hypothetical protein PLS49_06045 [Candidatus Woesebacteria bacterium]|nr:hypothetical protein [Candidatus Woesebacteria bacterium]
MTKIEPNATSTKKYKATPHVDMDELAEKWVEMMIETIISKDKRRLINGQILTYAEAANTNNLISNDPFRKL